MVTQIAIYWDLDTCPSLRIEAVVDSIRQICVLPNNLKEKRFLCFSSKPIDFNERQLKTDFQRFDDQKKLLFFQMDVRIDLSDGKTSLVVITGDYRFIEYIIEMQISSPTHLIYGNNPELSSIQLTANIKTIRFDKFERFCQDHLFVRNHFSDLSVSGDSSDNSPEDENPIQTQIKEKESSSKLMANWGYTAKDFISILINYSFVFSLIEMMTKSLGITHSSSTEQKVITPTKKTKNKKKTIIAGVCGLNNLGNTCYMNSALQCLSNVKPLTEFAIELEAGPNRSVQIKPLIGIYSELIRDMWGGKSKAISPKQFKAKISVLWDQFDGWKRNDCAELMTLVLNQFHEELRHNPNDLTYQTFEDYLKDNNTFIAQTFHGFQSFQLICECGQTLTEEKQSFSVLHLPQNDSRKSVSVFLLLKNKNLYKIHLKLAENSISVTELLRETAKTFEEICCQPLAQNNLIPILINNIEKSHMIDRIYENDSVINFDDMLGDICLYESDPNSQNIIFVVLMNCKLETFGIPLLLNLGFYCEYDSITDEFYRQIIPYFAGLTDEESAQLFTIKLDEHFQVLANTCDLYSPLISLMVVQPIAEKIIKKYCYPEVICIHSKSYYKLEDRLKQHLSVKKVEHKMWCNDCKTSGFPNEKINILYSPEVLILQLKSNPMIQSIGNNTEFPLVLDFGQYLSDGPKRQNTYDLIAVSNYTGSHYTAYAKNYLNKKWHEFNDGYTQQIDERKLNSSNAYLLIYIKR